MNREDNKNFLIFLGVFILASVVRFVFDKNEYVLNIIAGINIIALWYICYMILESVQKKFTDKISKTEHIGDGVKIKKMKHFKHHIRFYQGCILLVGLLYVILWANAIVNDIISLCALFLSVEESCICMYIQDYFFNKK